MDFDLEKVEKLLDEVCLDMMLISVDNLLEISGVIGRLAPLTEALLPLNSELTSQITQSLENGLTAVIRSEITDNDQVLALIGEGLAFLQDMVRSLPVGAPFKGDVVGWAQKLTDLGASPVFLPGNTAPDDAGVPQDRNPEVETKSPQAQNESPQTKNESPQTKDESPQAETESPQTETESPQTKDECLQAKGESSQAETESPQAVDECLQATEPTVSPKEPWTQACEVAPPEGATQDLPCDSNVLPLSVEGFRQEIIATLEILQALLLGAEHKDDPLPTLGDIARSFRDILGIVSFLQVEDMARLSFNTCGFIEYVCGEQVPYTHEVTDLLLRSCGFLMAGFQGFELEGCSSWLIKAGSYDQAELDQFGDELWMAQQGIMPTQKVEVSRSDIKPRSKQIGAVLVGQGFLTEDELTVLANAHEESHKIPLGNILLKSNLITPEDLELALKEQKSRPSKRLGEIIVIMGKLKAAQIDEAVRNQEANREVKLGEFLLKSQLGTTDKVALALKEQKQKKEAGSQVVEPMVTQVVKVETRKLDGLIDLVGELVIAQSLVVSSDFVAEMKEQQLVKDLAQVSRITSELQRNAMQLRMVQMSGTFNKMNRLVRDLGQRFGKKVHFETFGGDTDVDRSMADAVFDPLVHLMRNSMDHGLETPEERKAAGKPLQGSLRLTAEHQGGSVVITLADDGRGVDLDKVLKKAQDKNLVGSGEVLSEAAIHSMLFHPGFSTAATVTDISGRGVGLDVVRQSIEKLRGKVEMTSVVNQGATVTISLPLTLAIIDGMIIRVGEHRYVLPTISITESFRPVSTDYFTVKNQGEMIWVRKELLSLIRLDNIVGATGAMVNPEDALVMVVESGGEKRCLLVDEVLGKQEVVIKPLGDWFKNIKALAGATILGDGRVGLILDVAGLLEDSHDCGYGSGSGSSGQEGSFDDEWDMGDT